MTPTDAPTPSGAMLVWKSNGDDEFFARTPFGTTYVYGENDLGAIIALHAGSYIGTIYPDLEAARAACEADYRERMRAAGWVPAGDEAASEDRCKAMVREFLGLYGTKEAVEKFCAKHIPAMPVATVSADAIRAEMNRCEKIKREELDDGQECALAGDRDGATLHRYAASFAADFVDRLSAILPKPAPQEESHDSEGERS